MVTALCGRGLSYKLMNPQINTIDFNERPFIAIWEVTQACDLACVHCRASAQPDRNPMELSTDEGKILIDQIAALKVPVFVLTGGDPIKRPDLFELIGNARSAGVRVSLTPSATPLLTREVVVRLKEAGLARLRSGPPPPLERTTRTGLPSAPPVSSTVPRRAPGTAL